MAISEIELWLHHKREYADGVKLYVRYGKNDFLKKVFAQGNSEFNKQKLLSELTALSKTSVIGAGEPGDTHLSKGTVNIQKGKKLSVDDEQYKSFTDDVRAIHTKAMDLYKINARRQKEIYDLIKEAKAIFGKDIAKINGWLADRNVGEKVNVMLDTRDERNELLYQVDYYNVHKKLPSEASKEKSEILDKAEMKQLLLNVRSRISKIKKKIGGDSGSRDGLDKTLADLMTQKQYLEGRIDELI